MKRGNGRRRMRVWHLPFVVFAIASIVPAGSGSAAASPASAPSTHPAPKPHAAPAVKNVEAVPSHFARPPADPAPYRATHVSWPAPASATIVAGRTERTRAKSAPVWAQAVDKGPASVRVKVLDHAAADAAHIDGVLLSVSSEHSGPVRIGVDYGSFAQAYGGNYGSRLKLVSYPSCVVTTPDVAACRQPTPLASSNDTAASTVSAKLAVAPAATVLAAQSAAADGDGGGKAGSYAATTLKPSGSWVAGGSTGSFTYSYPITAPDAPSDLTPEIGLSYDSAATDGQTSATQAQASWLGEGWSTPEAYIEQSFQTCSESPEGSAAPTKTGDQCYDGPIYTLSLNGASTSLVWDASKKLFASESADGAVVKHFCTKTTDATCTSGTGNGSIAYDQDWWQVVERDGSTYSFGMNHLPGWASGKAETNSVATEPVYSAHSGDPCYDSAGMSSSACTMAWRWNLDYVVDPHDNAMAYYYKQDTNYYGKYNGASNVSYVRDTYLDHIDYGFRAGGAFGTAPDKIVYTTSERCVTDGCGPLKSANASKWPDVPFDLVCASGATCTSQQPSYYSTVRLTGIQAQQYSVSAAKYTTVDSYALTQTEPATGDGTAATLWLSQIVHTGSDLAGGGASAAIALPAVKFTPIQLENRVDTTHDGLPAFYKYRIGTITTETGSQINVTYGRPDPCTAPVKITPASNTSSCYPVSWTPDGYTDPITDWFNKWVVTRVVQTDPTGGASAQSTSYQYNGGAAWHFDDNELVKAKYRMYGQFRGYGDVVTLLGDGVNDRQAKTETTFYRGMGTNLTDSQGGVHADADQLAGETLELSSLLGDSVDHSTITSYWVSGAAATRTRTGLPALTSNWVAPVESFTRQAVTSGTSATWRYTATDTSYVTDTSSANAGLKTYQYAHTAPANAAYDSCTTTTYAPVNTSKNLAGLVASEETDSVACGGYTAGSKPSTPGSVNTLTAPSAVSRPAQVISATRNYYDDPAFDTTFPQTKTPTAGDVTMVRKADDYTSGAFAWQTTSRSKFDSLGRPTDSYDADGNDSVTSYSANSAGLVVGQTITNALGQATSSVIDPERGLTLSATDPNGVVTLSQYDALGRILSTWLNSRTTDLPANYKYTYAISATGPTAVTTQELNDESGYQTSAVIYDGLLRPRQTQDMTPQGGRLVTDTFYDSRGWTQAEYDGWWDSATLPNTTLASAADLHDQVPVQHFYTYNSLGAKVLDQNEKNGVEVSRTYTVGNGDRTTTYPPAGGTVSTTVTDPVGRTTEVDNYVTVPSLTPPSDLFTGTFKVSGGTTRALTYGYDGHGNQNTITQGSGGPVWTKTYDLLGRVTAQTDPDAGSDSGQVYDADGNLLQTTDARGKTVSYTYDALSRKTAEYASTVAAQKPGAAGNQVAGWVYDNSTGVAGVTHAIGQLTGSTAYSGGNTYTTQELNFDVFGNSQGTSVTIPGSENSLAGTYTVKHKYSTTTGLLLKDGYDAVGGLPAETVNHGYQGVLDLPDRIGGLTGYADSTTYDAFGRVNQAALGAAPNLSYVTDTYDDNSGRLTNQLLTRQTGATSNVDQQAYSYDLAGNLTQQTSTRLGSSTAVETQCFRYDGLVQLLAAWTANDNCAATPGSGSSSMVSDGLGASSAYWTTWTIDALGDRSQQVQHGFAGGPSADATTTYHYGTSQPHTLTSTSTTGGASTSYGYDAAGNMTTRNAGPGNQTLGYDDAGRLATVTGSTAGSSSFVYDADGGILVQHDPGSTTLYLDDEQFVLNTATGSVTGTRYYGLPGGGQAVRTGTATTAVSFALTDEHDTPALYLDYTGATPTWRQFTPYGEARGPAAAAPDNHGFLGKPADTSTGLTLLGAREYDPSAGRFTTADPVLEQTDPTQLNGYAYAGNDPVNKADPTGLMYMPEPSGTGSSCWDACQAQITALYNQNNGGSGSRNSGSGGGSHASSDAGPHRSCTSWICRHVKSAAKAAWHGTEAVGSFANRNLGTIVGAGVGILCTVATGGAGALVCGALGGLVGSAITNGRQLARGKESWGQAGLNMLIDTGLGAAGGALASGGGNAVGKVVESGMEDAGPAAWAGFKEGIKKVASTGTKDEISSNMGRNPAKFLAGSVRSFLRDRRDLGGTREAAKAFRKDFFDWNKADRFNAATQGAVVGATPVAARRGKFDGISALAMTSTFGF
ncbi:MAG TPA: RHS repeat-associated core domain-containing protein [Actinoplanes sp.]